MCHTNGLAWDWTVFILEWAFGDASVDFKRNAIVPALFVFIYSGDGGNASENLDIYVSYWSEGKKGA